MRTELSRLREYVRIIAEDMTNIAIEGAFEVSHFPLPGSIVIDALSENTLTKVVKALYQLPEGSIPYGFALLFLMPRKISVEIKKDLFKQILLKLSDMRKDFSLRNSMELKYLPYTIPQTNTEISVSEYRKVVFLLDNLSEIRVPVYRGWCFDAFAYDGKFYRVYNLGTVEEPRYVILSGNLLNNPNADVFGHIKIPEDVTNTKILGATPSKVIQLVEKEVDDVGGLETFDDKIEFVLKRWSKFLGTSLPLDYVSVQPRARKIKPELADRYRETIYQIVMELLTS